MVTEKRDDRGRLTFDKSTGLQKLRPLHNHKDANREEAVNSGLFSFRSPLQLGTDDQSIAAMFIKEEKDNKGYHIRNLSPPPRSPCTR